MAKAKQDSQQTVHGRQWKPKKKNRGIHSKKRSSRNKKSKNYRKPYRGQGRN